MDRTERQKVGINRWLKAGGKATCEFPTGFGFYYENFKNGSRSVQEWTEWLEGKIGESPKQDNPEVNN